MSLQHIQKNFPGILHTPAKYEKNPPYGCEAIVKRKCRSSGSGRVASPIYKQASREERLITSATLILALVIYIKNLRDYTKTDLPCITSLSYTLCHSVGW